MNRCFYILLCITNILNEKVPIYVIIGVPISNKYFTIKSHVCQYILFSWPLYILVASHFFHYYMQIDFPGRRRSVVNHHIVDVNQSHKHTAYITSHFLLA